MGHFSIKLYQGRRLEVVWDMGVKYLGRERLGIKKICSLSCIVVMLLLFLEV